MRKLIIKTENNAGDKCKTYIYNYENSIIFKKYTIVTDLSFEDMIGGEIIIRKTNKYLITFHVFSIRKTTLLKVLHQFNLV